MSSAEGSGDTLEQGNVDNDDEDEVVDFSSVGPRPAAPVEEAEEEEEDDGEPDPVSCFILCFCKVMLSGLKRRCALWRR